LQHKNKNYNLIIIKAHVCSDPDVIPPYYIPPGNVALIRLVSRFLRIGVFCSLQ
jgi:hypothetical protein